MAPFLVSLSIFFFLLFQWTPSPFVHFQDGIGLPSLFKTLVPESVVFSFFFMRGECFFLPSLQCTIRLFFCLHRRLKYGFFSISSLLPTLYISSFSSSRFFFFFFFLGEEFELKISLPPLPPPSSVYVLLFSSSFYRTIPSVKGLTSLTLDDYATLTNTSSFLFSYP